jgi:hypothetical protein
MRLREFANAEEQLELLRVIIDNTWAAIAKQAAEQRKAEQERRIAAAKVPRSRRGSSSVTPIPAPVPAPAAPKQQASVQDRDDNDNEFDDNPDGEITQKPASPHSKKSKAVGSAEKGAASSATSNGLLTAKHAITTQPNSNIEFDAYGDETHSRNGTSAQKKYPRIFQR